MTDPNIPSRLVTLVSVRDVGCTGVTLLAIQELEKIADDPTQVRHCLAFLRCELGGYASLWRLERELQDDDPRTVLARFAARLEADVEASIDTAFGLLESRPGGVVTAPSSGITKRLMGRLAGSGRTATDPDARIGISGADAIGPTGILNIVGTRELAERLPTVIVTTSDRFVPADVFASLGSPLFDRIPLDLFDAVVVSNEVLTPAEAGRRAARTAALSPMAGQA